MGSTKRSRDDSIPSPRPSPEPKASKIHITIDKNLFRTPRRYYSIDAVVSKQKPGSTLQSTTMNRPTLLLSPAPVPQMRPGQSLLDPEIIKRADPEFVQLWDTFLQKIPVAANLVESREQYEHLCRHYVQKAVGVGGIAEADVPGWGKYAGDVRVTSYIPPEPSGPRQTWPVYFNFRGGSFVEGSGRPNAELCHFICNHASVCVIDVQYRRCPEYPFPTPIMDCASAVRHILHNHDTFCVDPNNFAMGGEGAGATIALVLNHLLRDREKCYKGLKGVLALMPMIQHNMRNLTMPEASHWQSIHEIESLPLTSWKHAKMVDSYVHMSMSEQYMQHHSLEETTACIIKSELTRSSVSLSVSSSKVKKPAGRRARTILPPIKTSIPLGAAPSQSRNIQPNGPIEKTIVVTRKPFPSLREHQHDCSWFFDLLSAETCGGSYRNLAPKTLVVTAGLDPLRDEGQHYANLLRCHDNDVDTLRYEGVPHHFMHFDRELSVARNAHADVAKWIKERVWGAAQIEAINTRTAADAARIAVQPLSKPQSQGESFSLGKKPSLDSTLYTIPEAHQTFNG